VNGTVVAVDHRFPGLEIERQALDPLGLDVQDADGLDREAVLALCSDARAVLTGARFRFDAEAIAALTRCSVIVRYGVGVDNVDVDAAAAAGIWVAYVPDYCVDEVAEHTIASLLALNRRLLGFDRAIRAGEWGIPAGLPVHRLSVGVLGIVGFGRIGEAVAVRARALGLTVLASDPARPPAEIERVGAAPAPLEELLAQADYVSLHAPLVGRTILGREQLALLKPGAFLLNVARAGLVDEEALISGLEDGRIAGAALDVTSQEPLRPPSPLLDVPNLLLTPHAAWYSVESVIELRRKVAAEAARVLAGEPPLHAARDLG